MFRLVSMKGPVTLAAAVAVLTACGGGSSNSGASIDVGSGSLTGAGATFPAPFYQRAFFDYNAKFPQVTVNYQPVGSGAGIEQFQANTVDFGASDVPMGSTDIQAAGGPDALTQIPTTLGVVAIAYNLPNVSKLQLDGPTLANIYLHHITKWNDPAIAALNSGVSLPSTSITVFHRSDGSGTTYHFTDYLSKISDEWKSATGSPAKSIKWPTGQGASGNQAVAQGIQSTVGGFGYVELAYVVQANMQMAYLKNAAGNFLQASVAGATAAAGTNTSVSPTNFSITNANCDKCYPIAGFSWIILRTNYSDAAKGKAVVFMFKWLVTDGQGDGSSLQYAPLPPAVQQLALTNLKLIKAGGTAVLSS